VADGQSKAARMETEARIKERAARVQSALDGAFGVRAKSLERALHKTGRRLPRRLRGQAEVIVAAQALGGHPKMLRQIDSAALGKAEEALVTWLDNIDRADRRKGVWIGIGAAIGFNILLVVAVVVFWMWSTGRV